jgi:hypothetical protein
MIQHALSLSFIEMSPAWISVHRDSTPLQRRLQIMQEKVMAELPSRAVAG